MKSATFITVIVVMMMMAVAPTFTQEKFVRKSIKASLLHLII